MRVALFTPLPPTPTGIADYSHDLLKGLSSKNPEWIIEAITDAGEAEPSLHVGVSSANGFTLPPQALPVYQMGNSSHHDFIYYFAYRHSGVLVLHDLVLHHSRLASYLNRPEIAAYRADMGSVEKRDRALARIAEYQAEVETAYPGQGTELAEVTVRTGGGRILYAYPLYELLVRTSKMTLVHSHSARRQIMESCPGRPVERVRMGIEIPAVVEREEARSRLNQGPGVILASFGLVTPEKRITTALKCVRRLLNEGVDVDYYLVGPTVSHFDAHRGGPRARHRPSSPPNRPSITRRLLALCLRRRHLFESPLSVGRREPPRRSSGYSLPGAPLWSRTRSIIWIFPIPSCHA